MTVKRMDNVGIVVDDIDAAIAFFRDPGLVLEGRMPIHGVWAGRVTGVRGQRVEIAMMRTPDGSSRVELTRFDASRDARIPVFTAFRTGDNHGQAGVHRQVHRFSTGECQGSARERSRHNPESGT